MDNDKANLGRVSSEVVTIKVEKTEPRVFDDHPGLVVTLSLSIKDGWHVYANPSLVEGIPPTRVTMEGAKLEKVNYPPGEAKVLAASGKEKVALYEGKVTIVAHVVPEGDSSTAPRLTVHFQACNDRACLAPATLRVDVPRGGGRP